MGVPDMYVSQDGGHVVQIKINHSFATRHVGDDCPLHDGVYLGYEGAVVALGGKVVAVLSNVRDKWGAEVDLNGIVGSRNPVVKAIEVARKEREAGGKR